MSLRATLSSATAISLLIVFLSVAIATEPEIDVIFPDLPIAGERFGWNLSADGSLLVVSADFSGSVYVFAKEGESWAQEAKLEFPFDVLRTSFDRGGIAISGDTLVVGAPGDGPNSSSGPLGAAYVYTRGDGSWPLVAKLTPPEPISENVEGATFGASVAIDGANILVGAPGVDFDKTYVRVGAVYPYRFDGSGWVEQPRIDLPDFASSNAFFGSTIALGGSTAVVTGVRVAGFPRRAALVYEFNGASWVRTAVLQASDAADRWDLRESADISGDRIILRGFRNPTGERATSAAYIFAKNGSGWEEVQKLAPDVSEIVSRSGAPFFDVHDVALLDNTAVISGAAGTSLTTGGTFAGGAAVVFVDDGQSWVQARLLQTGDVVTNLNNAFGFQADITDTEIFVNAYLDDIGVNEGGAVYVFDGPLLTVTHENNLIIDFTLPVTPFSGADSLTLGFADGGIGSNDISPTDTARLLDGAQLLGVSSELLNQNGAPLAWKSTTSAYSSDGADVATVDFRSIDDGSIDGQIVFRPGIGRSFQVSPDASPGEPYSVHLFLGVGGDNGLVSIVQGEQPIIERVYVLSANDDSDDDGMPDDWEVQFGLNPADPSDADNDSDGD